MYTFWLRPIVNKWTSATRRINHMRRSGKTARRSEWPSISWSWLLANNASQLLTTFAGSTVTDATSRAIFALCRNKNDLLPYSAAEINRLSCLLCVRGPIVYTLKQTPFPFIFFILNKGQFYKIISQSSTRYSINNAIIYIITFTYTVFILVNPIFNSRGL